MICPYNYYDSCRVYDFIHKFQRHTFRSLLHFWHVLFVRINASKPIASAGCKRYRCRIRICGDRVLDRNCKQLDINSSVVVACAAPPHPPRGLSHRLFDWGSCNCGFVLPVLVFCSVSGTKNVQMWVIFRADEKLTGCSQCSAVIALDSTGIVSCVRCFSLFCATLTFHLRRHRFSA